MKRIITIILSLFLGLLALLLMWGLIEPYILDETTYNVGLPGLPAQWSGKELAVMGDLQVGMWLDNTATIEKAARQIAARQPAAVLLVGDFIYHNQKNTSESIQRVVELLQPLTAADLPLYAVLGNHDYAVTARNRIVDNRRADRLTEALEAAGIQVLSNEAVPLAPEQPADSGQGDPLYLVGIDSHMAAKAEPNKALAAVPEEAARVVIFHHPDIFARLPEDSAPLAVAGHTHGGQIRIPFTPDWSILTFVQEEAVHVDGWIDDYGQPGNELYVNRGIGFSIVPLRINCPPEVTYFRLTAATGQR